MRMFNVLLSSSTGVVSVSLSVTHTNTHTNTLRDRETCRQRQRDMQTKTETERVMYVLTGHVRPVVHLVRGVPQFQGSLDYFLGSNTMFPPWSGIFLPLYLY